MGNCSGSLLPADPSGGNNLSASVRRSSIGASRNHCNEPSVARSSSISAGLSVDTDLTEEEESSTPNLKNFSFIDLKTATRNFSRNMVLGVGGFGTVYKGLVDEKTRGPSSSRLVAIKKLNPDSAQGFEEWQSEVNFLGMLSHPNLVKLLGYCWENRELLLVYEFMQKGSLENHLFKKNAALEPLSWDLRLKIAIGAARGLAFLHNSEKNVIYRDFKASNILLDGRYNAKISDFGLAKLGPSGGISHLTTSVMGTQGYAAPEYLNAGHLSVKSDVYGFGVVLLELMTGLRALDLRRPHGKQILVDWMTPLLSQKWSLKSIMDSQIEGQYSSKAASEAAQLTLRCLDQDPRKRPAMVEVVECLERIAAMKKTGKESRSQALLSSSSRQNMHSPRALHSPRHRNGQGTAT